MIVSNIFYHVEFDVILHPLNQDQRGGGGQNQQGINTEQTSGTRAVVMLWAATNCASLWRFPILSASGEKRKENA